MSIDRIDEGIYRVLIPFEDDITTTVYVAVGDGGVALIDSATRPSDVDDHIIPALRELGISLDRVKYLLLTHSHEDHAGGAERLSGLLPDAVIGSAFERDKPRSIRLADGDVILDRLQVVALPGHTLDCIALYDTKTKTLLSADCLQLYGVGKYRRGVGYRDLYRSSIDKLRRMEIYRIVAAHEYDPLGSVAEGESAVTEYLDTCLAAIE